MSKVLGFLIYIDCEGELDAEDVKTIFGDGVAAHGTTYEDITKIEVGPLGEVSVDNPNDEE